MLLPQVVSPDSKQEGCDSHHCYLLSAYIMNKTITTVATEPSLRFIVKVLILESMRIMAAGVLKIWEVLNQFFVDEGRLRDSEAGECDSLQRTRW